MPPVAESAVVAAVLVAEQAVDSSADNSAERVEPGAASAVAAVEDSEQVAHYIQQEPEPAAEWEVEQLD